MRSRKGKQNNKQAELGRLRRKFRVVALRDLVRAEILEAVERTGSIRMAAQLLDMGKTSVYRLLNQYSRQGFVKFPKRRGTYSQIRVLKK